MTTPIDSSFQQILQYVFPKEVLEFFTITGIKEIQNAKTDDMTMEIMLEEKNAPPVIPDEYRGKNIISKGWKHMLIIQDFPLRDRFCILKIKRRRWEIEDIGSFSRKFTFLPESGLKVTTTFADFLKEADRTRASGSRTHRETLWSEDVKKNVS